MPNSQSFSASTGAANVSGTLTDTNVIQPAQPPIGLQAIGPRVTFNFITEPWNSNNTYSYYDVVNVSGASYVARQDVPVGIELTNTDYWFRWNDPNAQFSSLENTVNTFDARITTNTNNIATNTADIATNKENIATNTADIEKIKNNLANVYDMVVIGDSFSTDSADASQTPLWHTIVGQHYGYNVHNFAQGGAGYLVDNNTFRTQINNAISNITNKDNVKLIYMYGGWNDCYLQKQTGDIYNECLQLVALLQTNFTNAEIVLMGCNTFLNNPAAVANGTTAYLISYALNTAANYMGVEYIDTHTLGLGNITFFMQGVNEHPNAYGERMIAAAAIQRNSNNYISPPIVINEISGATGFISLNICGNSASIDINITPTRNSITFAIPYRIIPQIATLFFVGADNSIHPTSRNITNNQVEYTVSNLTSGTNYSASVTSLI